ncbi:MAG TPA: hypothetical protein PLV65_12935, partial [Tenuifilaceae bacterium]|nr:hypothetical protein [Tenuifilaceae bacterium]
TNRYRIYVNEGSKEHKAAKEYFAFLEAINNVALNRQQILSNISTRNVLLVIVHVIREDGANKAVATLDKLSNFIYS